MNPEAAVQQRSHPSPDIGSPSSADHVLVRSQQVAAGLEETFAFFSDPANLQALTPPELDFHILTPLPIEMRAGAEIEYRLRLHGIPLRWRSRIEGWRPGAGFIDMQLHGPYAKWVHEHTFEANERGTLVGDRVHYRLPLEPLSAPALAWFVRPQLRRIFDFRRDAMRRLLGEA